MIDRFKKRLIIKNNFLKNEDYLEERDKKYIYHYGSPKFLYPSEEQLKTINFYEHIWTSGDRLYKISNKYYKDPSLWWIILIFNKIGSEVSIKLGDVIKIPVPIEDVITIFL